MDRHTDRFVRGYKSNKHVNKMIERGCYEERKKPRTRISIPKENVIVET